MRNRRMAKLATGLLVGLGALGLLALPAAAAHDDADAEVTSGTLVLYDEFGSPFQEVDLADEESIVCDEELVSSITMENDAPSPNTWTATIDSDTAVDLGGGNWFRVRLQGSFSGTWAGGALSGTGSATATLWPSLEEPPEGDPCVIDDEEFCVIDAININISGVYSNTATAPDINIGDTFTVSGSNTPGNFETQVSGSATNCGSLIALNNGGVELVDVVLTALTG